jgi:hypothetical protein
MCCRVISRHIWRPTDELAEMRINGAVTFAAAVLQALDIKQVDATMAISCSTSLLQFAGYKGDAAALHARICTRNSLRQRQDVAVQQIAGL